MEYNLIPVDVPVYEPVRKLSMIKRTSSMIQEEEEMLEIKRQKVEPQIDQQDTVAKVLGNVFYQLRKDLAAVRRLCSLVFKESLHLTTTIREVKEFNTLLYPKQFSFFDEIDILRRAYTNMKKCSDVPIRYVAALALKIQISTIYLFIDQDSPDIKTLYFLILKVKSLVNLTTPEIVKRLEQAGQTASILQCAVLMKVAVMCEDSLVTEKGTQSEDPKVADEETPEKGTNIAQIAEPNIQHNMQDETRKSLNVYKSLYKDVGRCAFCTNITTARCGECFSVAYCSTSCQIYDSGMHSKFCGVLKEESRRGGTGETSNSSSSHIT